VFGSYSNEGFVAMETRFPSTLHWKAAPASAGSTPTPSDTDAPRSTVIERGPDNRTTRGAAGAMVGGWTGGTSPDPGIPAGCGGVAGATSSAHSASEAERFPSLTRTMTRWEPGAWDGTANSDAPCSAERSSRTARRPSTLHSKLSRSSARAAGTRAAARKVALCPAGSATTPGAGEMSVSSGAIVGTTPISHVRTARCPPSPTISTLICCQPASSGPGTYDHVAACDTGLPHTDHVRRPAASADAVNTVTSPTFMDTRPAEGVTIGVPSGRMRCWNQATPATAITRAPASADQCQRRILTAGERSDWSPDYQCTAHVTLCACDHRVCCLGTQSSRWYRVESRWCRSVGCFLL